jgi:hypothetical protein
MQGEEDELPALKRRRSNAQLWVDDCIAADLDDVARIAKLRSVSLHKRNGTASDVLYYRYACLSFWLSTSWLKICETAMHRCDISYVNHNCLAAHAGARITGDT